MSFYGEAKKTEDTCRISARARVFCALLSQRSFTAADEAEDYFYSGDFCLKNTRPGIAFLRVKLIECVATRYS